MRLNHVANRITKGNLDLMVELFTTQLGFKLLRRIPTDIWALRGIEWVIASMEIA
jgi:hypothetical protein